MHRRWIDQARIDPEYGGAAFAHNLKIAKAAVNRFGGQRLRQALEETGIGSHPEIVRAFWKVGMAMNSPTAPTQPSPLEPSPKPAKKTFAQRFYNKSNLNP